MTTTRRAIAADLPFLEEVFVIAADWNPEAVKGAEFWHADPTFQKYLAGFPRDTDLGFIAEREGQDAGAVWSRYFTAADPGYGFVAEDIPELSIGVVAGRRGEGIGRALLNAMLAASPVSLSLSVEDGNPAEELYRKSGFVPVGRVGNATTMLYTRRSD
ncbi:MAG TPA: GNAT family N-acetyltransferase [Rhodoglobus sp.]|nr:GNAT family N-acetyltransferase [Rhodoglobus sp.]HQA24128.1 GNAT family N-acetyltransferase [Rhodoglobus sp.]